MHKEYFEHFSTEITQEIEDYTTEEVFKESRYIFVSKENDTKVGYCTHCKKTFPWRNKTLKHNSDTVCPMCASQCKVKDEWRGRNHLVDRACFIFYEKSLKDPNVLIAKGYYAERYYKDYKNVYNAYALNAVYIFSEEGSYMLKKSYGEWSETSSIYSFNINGLANYPYYFSYDSIKKAVKNTRFQYSQYKKYLQWDMLKFFALYNKYPLIEHLTKVGMKNIVDEKLEDRAAYRTINWRGKTIYKMLKIGKKDLKDIIASKIKVSSDFIKLYQLSKKDNSNLSPKEVEELLKMGYNDIFKIIELMEYVSVKKLYKYFKKQLAIREKKEYSNITSTYYDYIKECIKLGFDLKRDYYLFPKDLEKAHQSTTRQIKIAENKEYDKLIQERVPQINEKFYLEHNELIIRAANSSLELIDEGQALGHCVGGYAGRYSKGSTNILFIRKSSEPDKPYYTMEVRDGAIIQIQGKGRCAPTEEVKKLLEVFKTEKLHINSQMKIKKSA